MKMLPLYSCIIPEHPGVPGAEVLPRRVGGTLLFAGLRIHLLCSCPAHFTANPSVTEVRNGAGHGALGISPLISGEYSAKPQQRKQGQCLKCNSDIKCSAVPCHAAVCIVLPKLSTECI